MEATAPSNTFHQVQQFFEYQADHQPDHIALICDAEILSYQELEGRANQLAHYLLAHGVGPGKFVVMLLERSIEMYVTILAVLKTGAAYVPLETETPFKRINYILADLQPTAVISDKILDPRIATAAKIISFATANHDINQQPNTRIPIAAPLHAENLCYLIYTSGSTGHPKGVEILHQNVCFYIQSARQIYQITSLDRVYQGFSIAFDASVEEIWMAWANGATLIASTSKDIRSGLGLIEFLNDNDVTVLCCFPSLMEELATLRPSFSTLRMLIFGGERCSREVIKFYSRPGLKIFNTYGPTEATVIATIAECQPDQPVKIGHPLPGYEVLVLDEHLQPSTRGEIYIGGAGLARGYLNQPELTAQFFVPHPNDPSRKLYRTGDLATVDADGALEFVGRIGEQVKLHGFRIELYEIELALLQYPGVKQAVVALQEMTEHEPILVAYLLTHNKAQMEKEKLRAFLSEQLPYYMMPSLFLTLAEFPHLPNGKVDRKRLPHPSIEEITHSKEHQPRTAAEKNIAAVWEKIFEQPSISIQAHFFYDLGGHSLLAARVVSLLRQQPGMQKISIRDLYQNPTIAQLAKKFPLCGQQGSAADAAAKMHKPKPVSQWRYYVCAMGQAIGCVVNFALKAWEFLFIILAYAFSAKIFPESSLRFIATMVGVWTVLPVLMFVGGIALKWIILGRVKPGEYPVWGWFYWRWWFFEKIRHALIDLDYLAGSPLINLYCRLMGAKIGKNCFINTKNIGIFDLLSIGENTSINREAMLLGAIIENGVLKIGNTHIGKRCYVGARSVISHNTQLADDAIVEDFSMLSSGATVAAGKYWYGSPARVGEKPDKFSQWEPSLAEKNVSLGKNIAFGCLHYLGIFLMIFLESLAFLPPVLLISHFYTQVGVISALAITPLATLIYYLCLFAITLLLKKLLVGKLTPGVCTVKSWRYLRMWMLALVTDIKNLDILADSLYYPKFMRLLGAKIGKWVELGKVNSSAADLFQMEAESFAASGIMAAVYKVYLGRVEFLPIKVAKKGFVGNVMLMPGGTVLGENSLLGCLTIPPLHGEAAQPNTAWLGSPAMLLPKREIISGFSETETLYPSKKLYSLRLLIEFIRIILPMTFSLVGTVLLYYGISFLLQRYAMTQVFLLLPIIYIAVLSTLGAACIGLKWLLVGRLKERVKPLWCVFIWKYDIIVYLFEDFFVGYLLEPVLGTPFASLLLRLFGCKIGKRAVIQSPLFTEFDLIEIGDDVSINFAAIIQTHLYEDRIFKMARIKIGNHCNVGNYSMVLYNTVMEDNSTLGNLSLLMKGEILPAHSAWEGIPAQSVDEAHPCA